MLKRNKSKRKAEKSVILFIFLIAVINLCFIMIDSRMRPQVTNLARYKVQSMITNIVNNTVAEQIINNDFDYDNLIKINQNNNGDVTFLSYNAVEVNRLKSKITSAVIDDINSLQETNIYIPLANITNIDILQNRGPRIKFTIIPVAYVEADIESIFENTGINQVSHKVYLVLKINATALVPNFSTNIYFENKVCIAQTVIIGNVPDNITDKFFQMTN